LSRHPIDRANRIVSIDALRGLLIAGMIVVNHPGSPDEIAPLLLHATWHGATLIDLGFPGFLFIAGVAMALSVRTDLLRGQSRARILLRSARRAAVLVALGLVLNAFPHFLDLAHLRIPGVLQRIGVACFIAAALHLYVRRNGQIAIAVAILLGYWAAMMLVPVPGIGAGVLEPGQDLASYVDRSVFGENHLYRWTRAWDAEGLLGTIPSIVNVLAGVFAGEWLIRERTERTRLGVLYATGAILIAASLLWHTVFPINKTLWTSSFVLFTSGAGCIALALFRWIIDVRGHRQWATPLVVLGMNAITVYFLSGIAGKALEAIQVDDVSLREIVFDAVFAPVGSPVLASALYAFVFMLIWLAIMWVLYRRGVFIRI
jgi:predicted acyltransferase